MCVVVLAVAALAGGDGDQERRPAPGFRLEDVREGRPSVDLGALRGKPVLLNFWASWCVPCEKELPAMVRVHREVGERVTFVGVDGMDSRRNARAMLERFDVPWASAYDPQDRVWRAYRNVGRPVTVLIDADGFVVERHNGELDEEELRDLLAGAFGDEVLGSG